MHNIFESFYVAFFKKRLPIQGRIALGRAPQSAKFLILPKAPREGEFSTKSKRGGTHKWGFPLA